jgi:hypothetical protein
MISQVSCCRARNRKGVSDIYAEKERSGLELQAPWIQALLPFFQCTTISSCTWDIPKAKKVEQKRSDLSRDDTAVITPISLRCHIITEKSTHTTGECKI